MTDLVVDDARPSYASRVCAVLVTVVTVPIVVNLWNAGGHPPGSIFIPFVLAFLSGPIAAIGCIAGQLEWRRGYRSVTSVVVNLVNGVFGVLAIAGFAVIVWYWMA